MGNRHLRGGVSRLERHEHLRLDARCLAVSRRTFDTRSGMRVGGLCIEIQNLGRYSSVFNRLGRDRGGARLAVCRSIPKLGMVSGAVAVDFLPSDRIFAAPLYFFSKQFHSAA